MGFLMSRQKFDSVMDTWKKEYVIYAPKVYEGGGCFSDTDCIRYGEVDSVDEIVFDRKSQYSFKEVLLPACQTLFYFTEETVKEAGPAKKGAVIFLRSCDLHAVKRLDDMYLSNGPEDYYYKRVRDNIHFVLMGCSRSFENCFCADMGTNRAGNYDLGINVSGDEVQLDVKNEDWLPLFTQASESEADVEINWVSENDTRVHIPENLDIKAAKSSMWEEYNGRCINCGRCNFVCPTCTCFTMQDLFYTENGKTGERRRVWASCMVDGYTDVAGGGSYRKKNGERMRFKVFHKVLDYRQRNGYHMCVGCGRCDDVCPEYISFSGCINKLGQAMKEVSEL